VRLPALILSRSYCTLKLKLFLNSCKGDRRLKAASILDNYQKNARKVVPQKMHFILDLYGFNY
jgi:hypothetical protein